MTKSEYNGWFNYETWLVSLWIDNDEGEQSYWQERGEEIYNASEGDDTFTKKERAVLDLDTALQEHFGEQNPLAGEASFWADMLNAALSEVNFYEIAEHMIEALDVKEETEKAAQ